MVGNTIGQYRILKKIGEGGMGEVFLAEDTSLGRKAALKFLPSDLEGNAVFRKRFLGEARAAAALNHPYVCKIYDVGEADGRNFISMEFVEGETLRERLASGPFDLKDALGIIGEIVEALSAAHRQNLVHRDLKPSNIMLTAEGHVKVMDFGLAKQLEVEDVEISDVSTKDGLPVGTTAYMAPERLKEGGADKRSDLFSLGVVFYEMLTRAHPFQKSHPMAIAYSILHDVPTPLSDYIRPVPPLLEHMMQRLLAKTPDRRYQAVQEVHADLGRLINSLSESESRVVATPHLIDSGSSTPRRSWLPWVLLGITILVAAAAIVMLRLGAVSESRDPVHFVDSQAGEFKMHGSDWPVVSPDGRWIVLSGSDREGRRALWLRELSVPGVRRLEGTAEARFPFWSPDSHVIGFFSDEKLKTVPVAGGPVEVLADAPGAERGSWNRDGMILFQPNNAGPIHGVSEQGGVSRAITSLDPLNQDLGHEYPHFLPDGRHFFYFVYSDASDRTGTYLGSLDSPESRLILRERSAVTYIRPGYLLFCRRSTLMAQPFDLGKMRVTAEAFPVAEEVGRWDFWAHFSVSSNGTLAYRPVAGNSRLTWFGRAGKRLGLLGEPGEYHQIALAPDGNHVAVDAGDGELWLVHLPSSSFSRFTFHSARDTDAVWSSDGSQIVFASDRPGRSNLFWKPLAGGDTQAILESHESHFPEDWAPRKGLLVYIGLQGRSVYGLDLSQEERKPRLLFETDFE